MILCKLCLNYQNNNQNLDILTKNLSEPMNRKNNSLSIVCDNISKELQDLGYKYWCLFEVIESSKIRLITTEDREQTLRYLIDEHDYRIQIKSLLQDRLDNKIIDFSRLKKVLESVLLKRIGFVCEVHLYIKVLNKNNKHCAYYDLIHKNNIDIRRFLLDMNINDMNTLIKNGYFVKNKDYFFKNYLFVNEIGNKLYRSSFTYYWEGPKFNTILVSGIFRIYCVWKNQFTQTIIQYFSDLINDSKEDLNFIIGHSLTYQQFKNDLSLYPSIHTKDVL